MTRQSIFRIVFFLLLFLRTAQGQPKDVLPEPLTLEYALSLADEPHPYLALLQAEKAQMRAEYKETQALNGAKVSILARARWIGPAPSARDQTPDDHRIRFFASKPLYDFGRNRTALKAAQSEIEGIESLYLDARQQRHIEIMANYFDVLLADLAYIRDSEAMAIAFVRMNRMRDRFELKQVSEIELLERESIYQKKLRQRTASEMQQRSTRTRLAIALNLPRQMPSTLTEPELPYNERLFPDVDRLIEKAIKKNLSLLALRNQVKAGEKKVQAARAEAYPVLFSEVEAGYFTRGLNFRDRWRAGFFIEIPLYQGGAVRASVARLQAELLRLQAELANRELQVRQDVMDTWLDLNTLYRKREEMRSAEDYRDLYLDRSRSLYELEVRADLGNAMVEMSTARFQTKETEYMIALAWTTLAALTGSLLDEKSQSKK